MGVRYLMQIHTECVCVRGRGAKDSRVAFELTRWNAPSSSRAGEWLVSISIHRFAPTPAAKFGLALDLAVLAGSTVAATNGPLVVRAFWASCALLVFWTTSSVAHHYAHAAERPAWEDVVLT